jgi:hypothetical protein
MKYQTKVMRAYAGPWRLVQMPGGHNAKVPDSIQATIARAVARWIPGRH